MDAADRERAQCLADAELDRLYIAMLREAGVHIYTGPIHSWNKPVTLHLGPVAPSPPTPAANPLFSQPMVDAGGGLMVDPDVLGHEGG